MAGVLTLFEEQTYKESDLLELIGRHVHPRADEKACTETLQALASLRLLPDRLESLGVEVEAGEADDEDWATRGDGINLLRPIPGGFKVVDIVGAGCLEPIGLRFEILPKLRFGDAATSKEDPRDARDALRRMWEVAEGGTRVEETRAAVEESPASHLHEWLVSRFLDDLEALLARGIRMQYTEREDNLSVLRGRLLPRENLRYNNFAPHRLYCRFDELSTDRPENRLIRSALERIARVTADASNKRRARSLLERLQEVPPSHRFRADFARWRDDRLMQHYRHIRSTCRWVLYEEAPTPITGEQSMFGCFTRMSKLFELYVERWLESKLCESRSLSIEPQDQRRLYYSPDATVSGYRMMRPDLVIYQGDAGSRQAIGVFDSKWKRTRREDGISREDAFQMVAYARFWLRSHSPEANDRKQALALVYPDPTPEEHPDPRKFMFEAPMERVSLSMLWFKLPRRSSSLDSPGWIEGIDADHLQDILGLGGRDPDQR